MGDIKLRSFLNMLSVRIFTGHVGGSDSCIISSKVTSSLCREYEFSNAVVRFGKLIQSWIDIDGKVSIYW